MSFRAAATEPAKWIRSLFNQRKTLLLFSPLFTPLIVKMKWKVFPSIPHARDANTGVIIE